MEDLNVSHTNSEFLNLVRGGSVDGQAFLEMQSYIFVDSDHWIEVLATQEPRIERFVG